MNKLNGRALAGKAVVVTGSGRGIGAACARGIARQGAAVVVNDVDADAAAATVAAIREAGGKAVAHVADIRSWQEAGSLIDRCVDEFGAIDGLMNNAGLFAMGQLDELDEHGWQRLIDVNLIGTIHCAAHAVRHMKPRGAGSIVNVTSGAHMGIPGMGIYGATKGAVASLTYTWAMELQATGVRVNAVSPQAETRMGDITAAYLSARGASMPGSQQPAAEQNSPLVEYLLSDAAEAITGQIVRTEGRQLALCSHPGILMPMLSRETWDIDGIAEAFATDLAARQAPLGIAGLFVEKTVSNPSAFWQADDHSGGRNAPVLPPADA